MKVSDSGLEIQKRKSSIVCCSANQTNWRWFADEFDETQVSWHMYNKQPRNVFERQITQPDLAMIRTCRSAIQKMKQEKADLLITHDPRVSYWCAVFKDRFDIRTNHIAHSFNFPNLPRGIKYYSMRKAFKNIDHFVVYSKLEKSLYHKYFGIPLSKIDVCHWSVAPPNGISNEPIEKGDYICAIGGNARDYHTLIDSMKNLPHIRLVLVARPHSIKNLEFPSNIKVLVNIPKKDAMNVLKHSRFMVLPLKGSEIPCGHVTLVAAMHLGKGFIITNSDGVSDYVINDYNALTCPAFSAHELSKSIDVLWKNPDKCHQLGANGKQFAQDFCSEETAKNYLIKLLRERGIF